jgi:hypothetical protein
MALLVCALPSGCGGSASNQSARTAAFVASANKACRDAQDDREVPLSKQRNASAFRQLLRKDRNLPSLHKLFLDVEAERNLRMRVLRAAGGKSVGTLPPGIEPVEESYRLSVRIYDDRKALGMTACTKRPPRPPIGGKGECRAHGFLRSAASRRWLQGRGCGRCRRLLQAAAIRPGSSILTPPGPRGGSLTLHRLSEWSQPGRTGVLLARRVVRADATEANGPWRDSSRKAGARAATDRLLETA